MGWMQIEWETVSVCVCVSTERTKQGQALPRGTHKLHHKPLTTSIFILHWNRFVKGRPWWLGGLWDRTLKATKSRERLIPSILSESEWKKKKINLTVLWYLMLIFLFVCLYFGRNECTMIGFWDLLIEEMFSQARLQVWTQLLPKFIIYYSEWEILSVCVSTNQSKQGQAMPKGYS